MSITTDIKEILKADLSCLVRLVCIAIRTRQGTNEWGYPSQGKLAEDVGSSQANVSRAIKELIAVGLVEKKGKLLRYKYVETTYSEKTPNMSKQHKNMSKQHTEYVETTYPSEVTFKVTEEVKVLCADKGKNEKPKTKKKRFVKPTLKEIKKYFDEREAIDDSKAFHDYHESKGWVVGRSPMKDWQAAIRTWIRNDFNGVQKTNGVSGFNSFSALQEPDYD